MLITNFIISLLVGLLIGLERERSHGKGTQTFGVRTFTLFSLLGTIVATINHIYLTITCSLFVFSIILLRYYRSTESRRSSIDIGVTTEISAGIVFCLGYMIPTASLLVITISIFLLLVLYERKRLHALARKKLNPHEIETTIILAIFILGVLPFLPNTTIDPWNLFNPKNFGTLMVTIACIQFAGYISIQLFGERFGMAITGFLGGLVSSTAVFANLNVTLRTHPNFRLSIIASAIFAILAMLIEVIVILVVASTKLFFSIAKPILIMSCICFIVGTILIHLQKKQIHKASTLSNPINIISIVYTSLFIGITLFVIAIVKSYIGNEAILAVSFLGGLFEIHGISLATALLYLNQNLTYTMATQILLTALVASFVSKILLLFSLTPLRFALQTSSLLLLILGSGVLTYWYY